MDIICVYTYRTYTQSTAENKTTKMSGDSITFNPLTDSNFLPRHAALTNTKNTNCWVLFIILTLLEPQSRSGDKPVKFQVFLSPDGTAVLKGTRPYYTLDSARFCILMARLTYIYILYLYTKTFVP